MRSCMRVGSLKCRVSFCLFLAWLELCVLAGLALPSHTPGNNRTQLIFKEKSLLSLPMYRLSSFDIAMGEHELRRMLKDRPSMSPYVKEDDELWQLTAQLYGGLYTGSCIYWNPKITKESTDWWIAAHSWSKNQCEINLRANINGKPVSGERLWSGLYFEFFNSARRPAYDEIHRQALLGCLDRSQYVSRVTQVEFSAAKQQLSFFNDFWKPKVIMKHGMTSEFDKSWHTQANGGYDRWFRSVKSENYPADIGRFFDSTIRPCAQKQKYPNCDKK